MIVKTPGVCGGRARIDGHRLPVWLLVAFRSDGVTDARLLEYYPGVTQNKLDDAWWYASVHPEEIAADTEANA